MFDDTQKAELEKKLDPKHVAKRSQSGFELSYIEGWHAIAEANRIFGFDGWTRETILLEENGTATKNDKGNHVVSFRAKVRITVGDVFREGVGFGSGISKNIHDAYESAIKEAETDAMKRAFMTFGNPFGLALYDKKQANVGIDKPEKTALTGDGYLALLNSLKDATTHAELNAARTKVAEIFKLKTPTKEQKAALEKAKADKFEQLTPKTPQQTAELANAPLGVH